MILSKAIWVATPETYKFFIANQKILWERTKKSSDTVDANGFKWDKNAHSKYTNQKEFLSAVAKNTYQKIQDRTRHGGGVVIVLDKQAFISQRISYL